MFKILPTAAAATLFLFLLTVSSSFSSLVTATATDTAEAGDSSSSSSSSWPSWSWSDGSSSWVFPGSSTSSSWWWSSSSGSDYSVGGSFYTIPNMWHDAGRMKVPLARSCGGFTAQGNMRYIGGYLVENDGTNASSGDKETIVRHSNSVLDLRFPDTELVRNISLPDEVVNASGPGSCALNHETGFTYIMLGNRQASPSSPPSRVVFALSDKLDTKNISLPFPVSRSCISAPILDEFSMTRNYRRRDAEQQQDGHSEFPAPDAIVLGGVRGDNGAPLTQLYGYNMRYGEWNAYCTLPVHSSGLCDCVTVPVPYNQFIAICNNCTGPQYSVYIMNLECDMHMLGGPALLRSIFGLDYVHGILVGKYVAFVYRPVWWGAELVVTYFDRELGVWTPEIQPKNLVPPRVHPGFFSWLGRLQIAGGQEIPTSKKKQTTKSVQEKLVQEMRDANLLSEKSLETILQERMRAAEKARQKRMKWSWSWWNSKNKNQQQEEERGEDGEPAFFAPAPATTTMTMNQKQQQQKLASVQGREGKLQVQQQSSSSSLGTSPPDPNDINVVSIIQEISVVKVEAPITLGGGADGRTFTQGNFLEIECKNSVYLKLSSTPDCLDVLRGTRPSQCSARGVALMQLNDTADRAFLCSAPGSCKVEHHERCPGLERNAVFAECTGGSGCCWHPTHGCYRMSTAATNGEDGYKLFYYLTSPLPVRVLPKPATPAPPSSTTAAPGGGTTTPPSNSHGGKSSNSSANSNGGSGDNSGGFINTRTGKFIIITCAVVVSLAIVLFFIAQYRRSHGMMGGKGGDFDLHAFVAERYDVHKELGRGGFGIVYLAVRKEDKKELALKVIACSSEDDVQSALSEFQLLRQIKAHPGMMPIIDVHCSWEYDAEKKKSMRRASSIDGMPSPPSSPTSPLMDAAHAAAGGSTTSLASAAGGSKIPQQQYVCIVMEYFSEGDLAHYIAKSFEHGGGPSETWLWTVLARQLFSVLAHLHSQTPAIWHRDLKPENCLMGSNGNRIVLTDFGLAAEAQRSFMSTRAGSFHYLAPEAWSHRYTASVDVWSAGCILYAAATGCVAPPAARVMFNDCRHPSFGQEIRDDLRSYSPDFANIVLSILKMDPQQRPSAAELLETVTAKCQEILTPDEEDVRSTSGGSVSGSVRLTASSQSVSVNGEGGIPTTPGGSRSFPNLSGALSGKEKKKAESPRKSSWAQVTRTAGDVQDDYSY